MRRRCSAASNCPLRRFYSVMCSCCGHIVRGDRYTSLPAHHPRRAHLRRRPLRCVAAGLRRAWPGRRAGGPGGPRAIRELIARLPNSAPYDGLVPGHLATPDAAAPAGAWSAARRGALRCARRLAGTVLEPTPATMRRLALTGLVASVLIILTGAAVRLTESGLGCPDWPKCTAHSLVAGGDHGDPLIHRWIEFGNRLVTDVIFVVAVLVLIAAWRYRENGRRRRDLAWLAAA